MIRLRSTHSPSLNSRRLPRPSYRPVNTVADGRPPSGPGNYIRWWGGYSVPVSVVFDARGALVEIGPSGFTSPITDMPDAIWTPR